MLRIEYKQLKTKLKRIESGTVSAITQAMLPVLFQLKRDADNIEPKTPHLTGHLKADVVYKVTANVGSVAYRMPYAEKWHETKRNDIKWSEPKSGPKYLESKINRFHDVYVVKAGGIIKGALKL